MNGAEHAAGTRNNTVHIDTLLGLGTGSLTLDDVIAVARNRRRVELLKLGAQEQSTVVDKMRSSSDWVADRVNLISQAGSDHDQVDPVYGINTGFGSLAGKAAFSDRELAMELSRRLIKSTACGVGPYLAEEVVRAAMLILANGLSRGYSGVRPELVNSLIAMLNADVFPAIPSLGSLGASGDLAPLSHLALVLSRPSGPKDPDRDSGEAFVRSEGGSSGDLIKVSGKHAMDAAGIERIVLGPKEGLALNAPISVSTAILVLAVFDAENALKTSEIALALTLEAVEGFRDAFLPALQDAHGQPGQIAVASAVYEYLQGSQLVDGDIDEDPARQPPQDAYSLRCAPQVLGAVKDTLDFVKVIAEREINAAQDNPLIFPDLPSKRRLKAVSGGNFHGEYVAMASDFLAIAITELASITERRLFRLDESSLNRQLPDMLVDSKIVGLDCGFMIPQYVAAALVAQCRALAHPDSVDSIPTCGNQEDHVSMSMNAALHAREVVTHGETVVAIELLMAAQGLDLRLSGVRVNHDVATLDLEEIDIAKSVELGGESWKLVADADRMRADHRGASTSHGRIMSVVSDPSRDVVSMAMSDIAESEIEGLRIVADRARMTPRSANDVGPVGRKVLGFIRSQQTADGRPVATLREDTILYPFIRVMTSLVHQGRFVQLVDGSRADQPEA